MRLIRGETPTADDLSTLRSIAALGKVKDRHVERVFNPDRKDPHLGTAEAGAGSMTRGLK
jgi:hypothetical protein